MFKPEQVKALETPLGNEYLNASLMPILPPLSELPSSLNIVSKADSPTHLPSFNSQPDMSRPSFSLSAAPSLRRNASSTTTTPTNRQSTLGIQAQKKRLSTIATSSSHGRLYKMLGDFFLLSGRIEDAAVWCAQSHILF